MGRKRADYFYELPQIQKHTELRTFILLTLVFLTQLSLAQSDNSHSARISIVMTTADNARSAYQRLTGEEALAFDLGEFLKTHQNAKDLKIRGSFVKDYEVTRLSFNLSDWDGQCFDFCAKTIEANKQPLLGVAAVPADITGVKVQRLLENTAAAKAGIHTGDIITAIEGEPVDSGCDLTSVIALYETEDQLDIDIIRNGQLMTIPVTLGFKTVKQQVWTACCQPVASNNLDNIETDDLPLGNLEVYPNPTSGIAQVKYRSDINGAFQMQITDVAGRLLFQQTQQNFIGYFDESIDLTRQAAGIYFLHIAHDGQRRTEKIVVQKK